MGYEFHITRAECWFEDDCPVTMSQIMELPGGLPEGFELSRTDTVTTTTPQGKSLTALVGKYLIYEDSGDPESRVHIYFQPDIAPFFRVSSEEYLRPVILLAGMLGASVQGDDGEVYTLQNGKVTVT